MPTTRRVPRALSELTRRRTWGELGYALVGMPLGIAGFVFTATTLTVGIGLSVTFIGLPLLAATAALSRVFGNGLRLLANRMTGTDVPAPPPLRPRKGLFGRIGSEITDPTAWRARTYLVLKMPIGILTFVVALAFWSYGLAGTTYALWRPFSGCNTARNGTCHHAIGVTDHYYLDSPFRIVLATVVGVLTLLAAPWAVRGVLMIDKLAVRGLLGPTRRGTRLADLERTRAAAVDDSAATLRRIERDLHDGAQARMVSVAMTMGLAREKLAEGADPAEASRLLDTAHASAKAAIAELRDLARGIHPAGLDAGLASALATLTSHSTVPVELVTHIDGRQDPAIETMAYFCVAELLTNANKHSGAGRVTVDARTSGPWLRLRVGDDGRGGARLGGGSGLTGLAERVATVDGTLTVDSPEGGPTLVTVDVPLRTGAGA